MGETKDDLSFEHETGDDWVVFVPAGMWHKITNIGGAPLKIYSIYAPPAAPSLPSLETRETEPGTKRFPGPYLRPDIGAGRRRRRSPPRARLALGARRAGVRLPTRREPPARARAALPARRRVHDRLGARLLRDLLAPRARPGRGRARLPTAAAPARRRDLAGLAPAWTGVGTLDLLYPEGKEHARRLNEAGVPCELHEVDGAYHDFDGMRPRASVSTSFQALSMEALRRGLLLAWRRPRCITGPTRGRDARLWPGRPRRDRLGTVALATGRRRS